MNRKKYDSLTRSSGSLIIGTQPSILNGASSGSPAAAAASATLSDGAKDRSVRTKSRGQVVRSFPSELEGLLVPTACLGDYRTRLWAGSLWPVALLLVCAAGLVGRECARERYGGRSE